MSGLKAARNLRLHTYAMLCLSIAACSSQQTATQEQKQQGHAQQGQSQPAQAQQVANQRAQDQDEEVQMG